MTIHAYTEPGNSLPAYINISEHVSNPGDVIVTVRSSGENNASTIILSRDQLRGLVKDAIKHLGSTSVQTLSPHQQRVIDEKIELDGRRAKLKAFFDTPIFAGLDEAEQSRLRQQFHAMTSYSAILSERMAAF